MNNAAELFKKTDFIKEVSIEGEHIRLYVREGATVLPDILRMLDNTKIAVKTIALSEPTLDDVFLRQTGRSLRDTAAVTGNGER